jgi:AraC family transcriptional activator of pobA
MGESSKNLYISNMDSTSSSIQSYGLFGESSHLPDVMHCETIAERSVLHGWELAPHRHARLHQVLLIQSGGGMAHLDGNAIALHANSLVNVPSGHVHAFRFRPGTQGWVATLADELLDEILSRVGDVRETLSRSCVIEANEPISQIMGQIWREFCENSRARALVLRGLNATLLGWVARAASVSDPKDPQHNESRVIQRFKELVDAHHLEHWRVADYAQALSVSPTHLNRLTRAATGHSASGLIEGRMMREARRQLAYTNLSVATIAYAMGFSDPAYFTRVFTRDAGLSPRAFRARLSEPDKPSA